MRRYAWLIVLLLLHFNAARSEEAKQPSAGSGQSSSIENLDNAIDAYLTRKNQPAGEVVQPVLPTGLTLDDLDETTKALYFESLQEYFKYRKSGYQHREKVFAWQLYSSYMIFFIVVALVSVGVYFSWLQFQLSLAERTGLSMQETARSEAAPAQSTGSDRPASSAVTEIEASLKGIKINSQVLGVIILVISLMFFYLYLVHVYPIEELF